MGVVFGSIPIIFCQQTARHQYLHKEIYCFHSMNSLFLPSSLLLFPSCKSPSPYLRPKPQYICTFNRHHHDHNLPTLSHSLKPSLQLSLSTRKMSIGAASPPDEGTVSVVNFEDFTEIDWSFLDSDELNFKEHIQRIDQIISAGEIDESSKVLVSISSEEFVDRVVESSPSLLLVVHDSLFVLAGIKEKYDTVKCWQGELIYVPDKWGPLDVVFLYFLPAMPFPLDQVFETLANRCSPGARVVISHPQGREALQKQRKQFPDVIVSDLPDQMTLQKAAEGDRARYGSRAVQKIVILEVLHRLKKMT